jgi:hypothetical protein
MLGVTMREMTAKERVVSNAHFDMREHEGGPFWTHLWGEVNRIREGAVQKVLGGLDHAEYLHKLGFIAALDEVLLIPGELDERNEKVKESLNGG